MQDWQHLGLEAPTIDLAAIKRAYAKRLRSTRPDDDAQAYQALREAYDRLVQRARWHAAALAEQMAEQDTAPEPIAETRPDRSADPSADRQDEGRAESAGQAMAEPIVEAPAEAVAEVVAGPVSEPAAEPEAEPATEQTADPPADSGSSAAKGETSPGPVAEPVAIADADAGPASPEPALPPPAPPTPSPPSPPAASPSLSPEEIQHALQELCSRGHDAVQAWLPELTRQLHLLPLSQQAEASARMADVVLHGQRLPAALMCLLRDHFGWLDDFRTARQIGAHRADALHEALADLERSVTDTTLLSRYAEMLSLNQLVSRGRSLRSLLIATLMHSVLRRQLAEAGPTLLQRFGIEAARQRRLMRLLTSAERVHMVALGVLIFGIALLLSQDLDRAAQGFGVALIVALPGFFVQLYLFRLLYGLRVFTSLPPRWAKRFQSPRWRSKLPWAAIGLLVAGIAGIAAADAYRLPPLGGCAVMLMALGLLHALPDTLDQALVAAALWIYAMLMLKLTEGLLPSMLLVWVLAGMQVNLSRLYRMPWIERAERPFDNSPWEAALLATIGLPTLLSRLTEALGYKRVLYALALAASPLYVQLAQDTMGRWPLMPAALVAALALLTLCHNRALRLGRRLLANDAHL